MLIPVLIDHWFERPAAATGGNVQALHKVGGHAGL